MSDPVHMNQTLKHTAILGPVRERDLQTHKTKLYIPQSIHRQNKQLFILDLKGDFFWVVTNNSTQNVYNFISIIYCLFF